VVLFNAKLDFYFNSAKNFNCYFLGVNQASLKLFNHEQKCLINRQETVSLLKEIIAVCGSFYDDRAVSIQNDLDRG
jgi:hypothetical protein